jgi:hypothetical protein
MPAPSAHVSFSEGVEALRRIEKQRQAREDRMRNALEILAVVHPREYATAPQLSVFVRATAREGLGRE